MNTFKRPISSLQLPSQQLSALTRAGYTTIDDLKASTPEQLAEDLNLPVEATQSILSATQKRKQPTQLTQSAASLLSTRPTKYTTFSKPLDSLLGGGLSKGSVLEISGPPGTAKESLAENITRSFLEAGHGVLFVDMQNMTSAARLREAIHSSSVLSSEHDHLVHYLNAFTLPDLMVFMNQLPGYLKTYTNIGLLVLNSLWFPFQTPTALTHSTRNSILKRIQETLSKACALSGIAVVTTTQLATKLVKADGTSANFDTGSRAILMPQPAPSYLPSGRSFRVLIVPQDRTSGVLRLLGAPTHVQSRSSQASREEPYELVAGKIQ
ncbi:P-loop containing nucleoside triphosphate hydrolase protein [Panus rudis PR-1116 ss-1]|nr:P-loop containing nucleoside triphosphate hydrolase protein [Panus rudis PR-1116 ss-1]